MRTAEEVASGAAVSFSQEVLLAIEAGVPDAPPFSDCPRTLTVAALLRTPCDGAILQQCLSEVVARHAVLRWSFHRGARGMVREVASPQPVAIERVRVDAGLQDQALKQVMAIEARRSFALDAAPLFRAQLFSDGTRDVGLLFTVHHLLFDLTSRQILCREVGALYGRLSRGERPALQPLGYSYDDYVARQRLRATDAARERWQRRVARPDGEPGRTLTPGRCDIVSFTIAADTVRALRAAATSRRVTLATALLAGYVMMASRALNTARVAVGVPLVDRQRDEVKDLIGLFLNILVVPVDVPGDAGALVDGVRDAFCAALRDHDVPYGFAAGRRGAPFDCTFDFIFAQECALALEGVDTESVSVPGEFVLQSAMALHVAEAQDTLRCALLFRSEGVPCFAGPELADELVRCFETIAGARD